MLFCFVTVDKMFKCHVCNSLFSTKGSMKVHMRLHTGSKPFKCPHCDQTFRTSGHRKSHIAQHYKTNPKKRRPRAGVGQTQDPTILPSIILNTTGTAASTLTAAGMDAAGVVAGGADNIQITNLTSLTPDQIAQLTSATTGSAAQIINLDQQGQLQLQQPAQQQQIQQQIQQPMSFSITDSFGNLADPTLTAQVLQGMEGLQLQLQQPQTNQIQISGLTDGTSLQQQQQTIQIDAGLLQQLQQGNINLTIDPATFQQQQQPQVLQAANPNMIQPVSAVNPNIVIAAAGSATGLEDAGGSVGDGVIKVSTDDATGVISSSALVADEAAVAITDPTTGVVDNDNDSDDEDEEDNEDDEAAQEIDESLMGMISAIKQEDGMVVLQQQALTAAGQDAANAQSATTITDPERKHICQVGKQSIYNQ